MYKVGLFQHGLRLLLVKHDINQIIHNFQNTDKFIVFLEFHSFYIKKSLFLTFLSTETRTKL